MDDDLLYHNVMGRFYSLESAFVFFCVMLTGFESADIFSTQQ